MARVVLSLFNYSAKTCFRVIAQGVRMAGVGSPAKDQGMGDAARMGRTLAAEGGKGHLAHNARILAAHFGHSDARRAS